MDIRSKEQAILANYLRTYDSLFERRLPSDYDLGLPLDFKTL